nr:MAG TPA: hypothetical protein [Bacteriophage sp.]
MILHSIKFSYNLVRIRSTYVFNSILKRTSLRLSSIC